MITWIPQVGQQILTGQIYIYFFSLWIMQIKFLTRGLVDQPGRFDPFLNFNNMRVIFYFLSSETRS